MNALLGVALAWVGGFTPFTPTPPCADMPANTVARREAVIRCVAEFHFPGDEAMADKALRVARCESYPWIEARLEDDGNLGAFQMRAKFWHDRWVAYGLPLGLPNKPLRLVVNAHVALGMVADYGGWSHWSCGGA